MTIFTQLEQALNAERARVENWDILTEEEKQAYREFCDRFSEMGNTEMEQTIQAYKWFLGAVQESVGAEHNANATAIVFLKGGREATMKCSEVDQFMIDHADELEARHVPPLRPRQPRRLPD